jgi:hypothetical protein
MAKAVCAGSDLAMPSGNPYSRMARTGHLKGKRPPRVNAVPMKTAGICHGEKLEIKPEAILYILTGF